MTRLENDLRQVKKLAVLNALFYADHGGGAGLEEFGAGKDIGGGYRRSGGTVLSGNA